MGNFKFALTMLKKDKRKNISYALTMLFAIVTIFIFFNIINNPNIKDNTLATGGTSLNDINIPLSTIISLFTIMFCCFMLGYANNFYLAHKMDEISIMNISGSTYLKITLYLTYQLLIILLFIIPLSLIMGTLITYVINYFVFSYLNVSFSIYNITANTYTDTLLTVLVIIFVVLVLDSGYIYRHDLKSILMSKDENISLTTNKIPNVFYYLITVIAFILILITPYNKVSYTIPSLIGSYGLSRVICNAFPSLLDKLRKVKLLSHKLLLISLSLLSTSLKKSSTLIMLYIISSLTLMSLMLSHLNSAREFIITFIAFIVIIFLLSISIMYKYISEIESRKILFFNLYKLGYIKKDIKHIICIEVFSYYLTLALFPLIYILELLFIYIFNSHFQIYFIILIISMEIIPILIMSIITYRYYIKTILKKVEQVL